MSSVFHRGHALPSAVRAEGVWITDSAGRRYLDAAGGAVVNGVGHGRREVIEAISRQLAEVDYVHAAAFTTPVLEEYAWRLAARLPLADGRVFPVSGGSEAIETALKLARAFHLAHGEPERNVVLARWGSYHGNTLGALDASGRLGLRAPYTAWLGRVEHLPAVNEYRCPNPAHPDRCGLWHADRLESRISELGPGRVAALVAEPIGGATTGATVPPADYWPAVADVCRRHGVLIVADEVMTGFGRTGRWFGIEHFAVEPDIVVAAKGAASGYWPLGICAASGGVAETVGGSFVHGFTFSHHPAGAAAGLAVLDLLERERLVDRSAGMGARLLAGLRSRLAGHPMVGDVRGRGLMVAVELVADVDTATPFPRARRLTERVRSAAFERGLLVYPAAGCADGSEGDGVLLGPPLVIEEEEADMVVERLASAIEATVTDPGSGGGAR